jgi:hypothetical protein
MPSEAFSLFSGEVIMVDTLAETITLTDTGLVNRSEDEDMTCPSTCCSTTCPETSDVTVEETIVDIGSDVISEIETPSLTVGPPSTVTLAYTPVSGIDPMVFVNGVAQRETTDYSISAKVVTFVATLNAGDVVMISYYHET